MVQNKRLSVFVVLVLSCTTLLAACSSDSSGSSPSSSSGSNSPKPADSKRQAVALKFLAPDESTVPYAKEAKADDRYAQELSKLYSQVANKDVTLTYEWLDGMSYQQLLTLRFASGELPDIIKTYSINYASHPTAVENGIFLELNDLLDKYGQNIKKKFPAEIWKDARLSKNGKIYGLPIGPAVQARKVVFIRQDWLEKFNMKTPVTVDDYLAYFEAVKTKDPNGNGLNDEIPFGGHENLGPYNALFFGNFGVHPNGWNEVNGQLIPDMINPKMKDVLRFWKMLYDKGYVNRDLFTKPNGDKFNDIYSDKVGMWIHDATSMTAEWNPKNFKNPNAKLDVLPGPTNEKGETRLIPLDSGIGGVRIINAKTKYAKEAMEYLDWTVSDDPKAKNFFSYGIEGYNYTVDGGKIQYDANAPANLDKGQSTFLQVMMYPLGDNRLSKELIDRTSNKDLINKAIKVAEQAAYNTPNRFMPPLDTMSKKPELQDRAGTLFLDMFAKVVTGKEPLDAAFDKFVANWKQRGGEQAIKEANDWYKNNK